MSTREIEGSNNNKISRSRIDGRITAMMIGTYIYCANINVIHLIYVTV